MLLVFPDDDSIYVPEVVVVAARRHAWRCWQLIVAALLD
jgi:hypothetical protein